jgi:hypothetical protein
VLRGMDEVFGRHNLVRALSAAMREDRFRAAQGVLEAL